MPIELKYNNQKFYIRIVAAIRVISIHQASNDARYTRLHTDHNLLEIFS